MVELIGAIFDYKEFSLNYQLMALGLKLMLKNKSVNYFIKMLRIVRYNWLFKRVVKNRNCDYVLMSEGFIQYFCHVFDKTLYTIKIDKILEVVRVKYNLSYIGCDVDIETSINRINSRDDNPKFLKNMTNEELRTFIRRRDKNMKAIRNDIPSISYIDMHQTINTNIEILESIMK
ncbi:MAG: hypothetical protein JEZ08_17505 [Clostridiales bacterium]|nr:hypothetical protein [Clostridiales bacterium]